MDKGKQNFGVLSKLLDLFGLSNRSVGFQPTDPRAMSTNGHGSSIYNSQSYVGQDWESKKRDWRDMSTHDIIQAALNLYAEEATIYDNLNPSTIWIEASDSKIQGILTNLLNRVGAEDTIFSKAWNLAAFGNVIDELEFHKKEGVVEMIPVFLDNIERVWDYRRKLIGFRGKGSSSISSPDLRKPWDFLHFRRMAAYTDTEWGEAVIEPARSVFKKFSMVEGAMITYRLNMNPNRLSFEIDTGESDPFNQMRIVEEWKRTLLANQYINQTEQKFENIYAPPPFEGMLFSPRNNDDKSSLSILAGDTKFPEISDYVVMFHRLAGSLGIPPTYLGDESETSAKNLLIQEDVRFARKILSVRKPLITGFKRLSEIHLSILDIDPKKVEFDVKMSQLAPLDAEMRMELLQSQLDVVESLVALGDSFQLDRASWFRYIFKTYMNLPDDVIELFVQSINNSSLLQSGTNIMKNGKINERGNSSSAKMKEEIDKKVGLSKKLRHDMESVHKNAKAMNYYNTKDLTNKEPLPNVNKNAT